MKRVFVFIGLKVAELSAIVFGPYFLGMLVSKWPWLCSVTRLDLMPHWIAGIMFIFILFAVFLLVALVAMFCIKNWELTKKICK